MNNLKRVLSLGLSGALMASLMITGASAIDAADFSDADKIQKSDAVSAMTALNIINGQEDGSFNPTGEIKRGEMAKMLCVAMNGGVDPVLGTKPVPTFTDTQNHWAAAYIEYCVSKGYIAGRGDGTFGPDDSMTSSELAKVILGALGYKTDDPKQPLVGADWVINTNVIANSAGLYKKLGDINTTDAMSRENAAQMLFNALSSDYVTYENGDYKTATYTYETDVKTPDGTVMMYMLNYVPTGGNGAMSDLAGALYTSAAAAKTAAQDLYPAAAYTTDYTLTPVETTNYKTTKESATADESFGHKYLNLTTVSGVVAAVDYNAAKKTYGVDIQDRGLTKAVTASFSAMAKDPTQFMGERVKVLFKDSDDVYGVYRDGDGSVLATGYSGLGHDIEQPAATDRSVKISGTSYKLSATAANVPMYPFNTLATQNNGTALSASDSVNAGSGQGFTFKLVDLDGDGKGDSVTYQPFYVGEITFTNDTLVTVTPESTNTVAAAEKISGMDKGDVELYDGAAKGDKVTVVADVYTAKDMPIVSKADVQTGTVDGIKTTESKFLIADQWMTGDTFNLNKLTVGDTVDYVAFGSTLYYAKVTSGYVGSDTLGVITAIAQKPASGVDGVILQAKIKLSNGSSKTVTVAKFNDVKSKAFGYAADAHVTGPNAMGTSVNIQPDSLLGELVSYKVNSDGDYELKSLPETNGGNADYANRILGYDGMMDKAFIYREGDDSFSGVDIADDATVFVYDTTDDSAEVISGKSLINSKLAGAVTAADYTSGMYSETNGYDYAQVMLVKVAGGVTTTVGTNYAYLTADAYQGSESGTTYRYFPVWDGTQDITYKEKSSDSTDAYVAGDVIAFNITDSTNKVIKDVDDANATASRITGVSGTTKVQISGTNSTKVNDSTTVIYVNSGERKGVAGGTFVKADTAQNVMYVSATNNTYALLVVDINNNLIPASTNVILSDKASVATVENALASHSTVMVYPQDGATFAMDKALTVPKDTTLIVAGNLNDNGHALAVNGDVTVRGTATLGAAVTSAGTGAKTLTVNGLATVASETNALGVTNLVINGNYALQTAATVADAKSLTVNGDLATTATNDLTVGSAATTASVTVTGDITGNGTVDVRGSLTAEDILSTGALTLTDGTLSVGDVAGALTVTAGTATVGAIAGNVSVADGTLTAGVVTGTLGLTAATSKATVTSVTGVATLSNAAAELTVSTGTLVYGSDDDIDGKVYLNGNVKLANGGSMDDGAKIIFNGAYDLEITAGALAKTDILVGAKDAQVKFVAAAPTATVADNTADSAFYTTADGLSVMTAANSIATNVFYKFQTTGCGKDYIHSGWVKV